MVFRFATKVDIIFCMYALHAGMMFINESIGLQCQLSVLEMGLVVNKQVSSIFCLAIHSTRDFSSIFACYRFFEEDGVFSSKGICF